MSSPSASPRTFRDLHYNDDSVTRSSSSSSSNGNSNSTAATVEMVAGMDIEQERNPPIITSEVPPIQQKAAPGSEDSFHDEVHFTIEKEQDVEKIIVPAKRKHLLAGIALLGLLGFVAVFLFSNSRSSSVTSTVTTGAAANNDSNNPLGVRDEDYYKQFVIDESWPPTVLIHLGPRLTGTNEVEEVLQHLPHVLARDGLVYEGRHTPTYDGDDGIAAFLHLCHGNPKLDVAKMFQGSSVDCAALSQLWEEWKLQWKENHDHGLSVVFSDGVLQRVAEEAPHRAILESLRSLTAPYHGHRHLSLTYRHYVEWVVAEHAVRHTGNAQRPTYLRHIRGFVDWYRETKEDPSLYYVSLPHWYEYQQVFDSIRIFNLEDPQFVEAGPTVSWVCETLAKEAPRTCNRGKLNNWPPGAQSALQSHSLNTTATHARVTPKRRLHLEATRLAQLHLTNGVMNALKANYENEDIQQTAEIIQSWLIQKMGYLTPNQTPNPALPMECLTTAEELELWSRTLALRDQMIPDYDPKDVALKAAFDEHAVNYNLCQIDYHQVVSIPSWKNLWLANQNGDGDNEGTRRHIRK